MDNMLPIDIISVCNSSPESAACYDSSQIVLRDNALDTIDLIFQGGTQIITVEGEEGIGKTTLLLQFANRYSKTTISLFIRSINRWGYDPEVLRYDLCNQLNWIINNNPLENPSDANDAFLRSITLRLMSHSRIYNKVFYFLVDGLEEIPEESSYLIETILGMIPIGAPNFRFIFSGSSSRIFGDKLLRVVHKPFFLTGFTLDETEKYFSDLRVKKEYIEDIYLTCRRKPGNLATVKRILQSGIKVETFMKELPEELKGLFEIEWRSVHDDEIELKILALIAHDSKKHTLREISNILEINENVILNIVSGLSFIEVNKDNNYEVNFISNSYKKFAVQKLKHLKSYVNDLMISYLLKNPDSESAMTLLPGYYQEAGKLDDLINYLSPEHFLNMLSKSQSLSIVQQKVDLGISTSNKLKKDGELLRFSLQKSIMKELEGAEIWRSEIEAKTALNDYDSAITLAQATLLIEDRLHLLAVICKKKRENGLAIEPELIEQINQLYYEIDATCLRGRSIEIASDLIYVNPDLAIELVEKATDSLNSEEELDMAFAKLSISAIAKGKEENYQDAIESISSKIKNPSVKDLYTSVNLLIGNYTAKEVINEVEKLESATNRLFLLRQWTLSNPHRDDALEVIEYALTLTIKTTTYAPNARMLRELATPLPFIKDKKNLKHLIANFDSLKVTIEKVGPTEDYIRLQLILAHTESEFNKRESDIRILEIYYYICEIKDLEIKAICIARLVAYLHDIDSKMEFEQNYKLFSITHTELANHIEELLLTAADHYHVTRGIIKALAKSKPKMAYKVVKDLNTQHRRDLACLDLISEYIEQKFINLNIQFLKDIFNSINDSEIKDKALLLIISKIDDETVNIESKASQVLFFIESIKNIYSSEIHCITCCLGYSILKKAEVDKYEEIAENVLIDLNNTWDSIDVGWHKVDIGFKIASYMSKTSIEIAKNYIEKNDKFRNGIVVDSNTNAKAYLTCLDLAIRAYSGLLPKDLNTEGDFERITNLIEQIPSFGVKAKLWGNLALRCYINDKKEMCKRIVNEHVRPLLAHIPQIDKQYSNRLVTSLSPALYCAHKLTALETIDKLDGVNRDYALVNICTFLLYKQIPEDPYDDTKGFNLSVTYDEILEVCDILRGINNDSTIYYIISCISEGMHFGKKRFTIQQQLDCAGRLKELVCEKLPDKKNIKHEGYRIICEAQIARFQKTKTEIWLKLIDSAYNIPNLADRAYVLCIISNLLPVKESNRQVHILKEVKDIINSLPSVYDRIGHYEMLAFMSWQINSQLCRDCLQIAMKSAISEEGAEFYKEQRNIVDLAYRLDPELAASLATLADDDEARSEARSNLRQQLKLNNLKKSMIEKSNVDTTIRNIKEIDYAKAAWKLLGALNAGRIETIHANETREYIEVVSKMTLTQSYPIIAWIIENTNRRYSRTDQALVFIRPLFEAITLGTELSLKMSERSSTIINCTKRTIINKNKNESLIIKPGEREYAIHFLRLWFEQNVNKYIKICDPYFGLEELEVLQLINSTITNCRVQILSSIKYHNRENISLPWENSYRSHWRLRISDQDPPDTEIVIVGTQSRGELPIHDRWWITDNSGIRLGTSYNSIGLTKTSDISILNKDEALLREKEIDQYLFRTKREHNGEKLDYRMFTL